MIYETPTHLFLQLFHGHFILQTISLRYNFTRFVEILISFLFIEKVVKNVAWVPGEVWINCPLPSSQNFRQLVKFWMGSCCFGTIKDLRLGFLLSESPIGTICPGGGWGGGGWRPPNVSTPFLPGSEKKGSSFGSFKSAENRRAWSLWVPAHRYTRISCKSKLLWEY